MTSVVMDTKEPTVSIDTDSSAVLDEPHSSDDDVFVDADAGAAADDDAQVAGMSIALDDDAILDGKLALPATPTEGQRALHQELRRRIDAVETDALDDMFLTDSTLYRYLRAREYNVDKAEKMLLATLKWRKDYGVNDLVLDGLEEMLKSGKQYLRGGRDKLGRPVIFMRPGREDIIDQERNCKFLVLTLLAALELMQDGVETWSIIIDYHGMGVRQSDFKTNMAVMHIMLDHFPEHLGCAYLINAPRLFSVLWSCIKPFLSAVTLAKVHFISTNPEWKRRQSRWYKPLPEDKPVDKYPELFKFFSRDVLETDMGGTQSYEYHMDQVLPLYHQLEQRRLQRNAAVMAAQRPRQAELEVEVVHTPTSKSGAASAAEHGKPSTPTISGA